MQKLKLILKFLFALFFVLAGFNHFFSTTFYLHIMPSYLPWHPLLVYLSGLFEIVLGILLLIPKFTQMAAWGLIALLIAVFPANIQMAVNHELYQEYNAAALWLRLPLQFMLIGWAYCYTLSIAQGKKSGKTAAA
jgi:uncharacterized membrane protein